MSDRNLWNERQVKIFVQEAIRPWGSGWNLLGEEIRAAIIDARAFAIIRHQHRESVPVAAMDELRYRMHASAGLMEQDS